MTAIWTTFYIAGLLLLPGLFLLSVTRSWERWQGLQRWFVALALGIAFYPTLFYMLALFPPSVRLGAPTLALLLLFFALYVAWTERTKLVDLVRLAPLEWLAALVVVTTLVTRLYVAHTHPYPAWSDSLHHALLTQLTAEQGRFPSSLEPYFPVPLQMYHMGLYGLSASLVWLGGLAPHSALLWMAQFLNGLCGIGVYLVLDRLSGRLGAIAGAVAVGLLFHQPAFYVNWGRFTQLASQSIMLAAWLVTFDTLRHWVRADAGRTRATLFRQGLAAALLTAAVFLLHFRVFAFYVALLAPSLVMVIGRDWSAARWRRLVTGSLYIGGVALVFVSPALWDALAQYRASITLAAPRQLVSTEEQRVGAQRYYEFPLEAYYGLGIHRHMAWASLVAAALGLLRRNGLVVLATVWTALLLGLGYAYLLPVRWLAITNLGAVIIMLYLPASLAIGVAVEELYRLVCRRFAWAARPSLWAAAMVAAGLVVAPYRARDLETYRYFVTESDVRAMDWIRANTAPDALFAVNTYFWLPTMAHGMDAGYWIPYFTGRRMTAGVMLVDQADVAYQARILELSRLVEQAKSDPLAVAGLQEQGVDYIYLGPIGNIYTGPLDAQVLRSSPLVETVYDEDGVVILRIKAVHP